uniref:4-hydroxy-tetrahydrodipicolinate synthase n=1 Tax=Compsopogon caeruleus TaxID=31354 RepID=A0A7S1TE63_9RHOD
MEAPIAGDRIKVIAGAGSNSTLEAIEATRRAAKMGLDGTLQVAPYYNKPPQEGLLTHFQEIARCEPDLPVMLYNIPGRCGVNMLPETTAKLSEINNVVAIKEAAGNMEQFSEIRRITRPDFHMYSGDDSLTLPLLSIGGTGVVSVASHFIGSELRKMIRSFKQGQVQDASEIHFKYFQLFKDLFIMTNPVPTKAGLRLLGFPVGPVRLPLTDATPEVQSRIADLFKELGLL